MRDVLTGGAFEAFFAEAKKPSTQFCFVVSIEPPSGSPAKPSLYFTDHDEQLEFVGSPSIFYEPTTSFSLTAMRARSDGSVDNLAVFGVSAGQVQESDLVRGYFDDAEINVGVACWSNTSVGILPYARGYLGEVKSSGAGFEIEIRALTEYMQRAVGRAYMTDCQVRRFGDTKCGLDVVTLGYVDTGKVSVLGGSNREFTIDAVQADQYYQMGEFIFLTGQNAGWSTQVLRHLSNVVGLVEVPPYPVTVGDDIQIERGCPRTYDFCLARANLVNYRGFPAREGVAGYFHPIDTIIRQFPNAK